MAVRLEVERTHGILRVMVEGRFDDSALEDLYRTVGARFVGSGARAAILDLTGVTDFAVSSELIQRLSRGPTALPEPETPRFIVAPQAHVYGAMRVFQSIGEPKRPYLVVVHSAAEAYAALGIAEPRFQLLEP